MITSLFFHFSFGGLSRLLSLVFFDSSNEFGARRLLHLLKVYVVQVSVAS